MFLAAALILAAPALAQRPDAPLGEIVEALPMPEDAAPAPARRPAPPPGGVATTDLPPSAADPLVADPAEPDLPAEAEAAVANAWELERERRRAEINAEESPLTARLNEEVAARHAEIRRRNAEAEAAHARAVAAAEAEARRVRTEHQAALDRHRREVERLEADHRARVAACLAGDHTQCAPRPR